MKLYLANPPFTERFGRAARWQESPRGGTLYYPLWLACGVAALQTAYKDIRLVDAPAFEWSLEDLLADAQAFNPEMVVVDTSFTSLGHDISVAQMLKDRLPGAKMIVVGPPANEFGMMMASNPGVDAVATPEYDFTLVELAQAIEEGRGFQGIRGIIYRREDGKVFRNPPRGPLTSEELDRMSFVSKVYKEHLNIKDYFLSSSLYPEIQIFTARGCPYKCSFCSWPQTFTGRQYRPRSIPNVMEELEFIRNEMPQVNEVFIEDDTFTIYKERVLEYCNEVRRRKLDKIPWSCNVRANGVDYETLVALKRAGCRMIITGYESGSDVILRNIVKGANVEQARRFTKEAKRAGLLIQGDFIIGLPGETKETIRETRRFIDEIRPNFLQVAIATPIPGTSFYQWAQANNAIVVDDLSAALDSSGFQRSIISYDGLSAEEIDESVDQILKDYYLTPKYVPIAMSNVLRRNGLKEAHLIAKAAKPFMFKYLRRNKPPAFGSVPEEVQELDLIR